MVMARDKKKKLSNVLRNFFGHITPQEKKRKRKKVGVEMCTWRNSPY